MTTIIHMSDIHLGAHGMAEAFEEIVQKLESMSAQAADYVVCLTGDLVENARNGGHNQLASQYISRLTNAGFRVLAIPGNHDYGTGSHGEKEHINRFKRMAYGSINVFYPKLDFIDDIAFIGLDSMAEELNFIDAAWAEGELGSLQRERLEEMLDWPEVQNADFRVVYLHHHPFDSIPFMQLKDSHLLKEILEGRRIDVLLYGHNHKGKEAHGTWGIPVCLDASSTTGKNADPTPVRTVTLTPDQPITVGELG